MDKNNFNRRDFVKAGLAAGGIAMAGATLANRHPHPRPTSLQYLDRNMYRKNTHVLAVFDPGEERGAKMQMMAIGDRRYLFNRGDVIDVKIDGAAVGSFKSEGVAHDHKTLVSLTTNPVDVHYDDFSIKGTGAAPAQK